MARILVVRQALLAKLDQLLRCNLVLKPVLESNIGSDCLTSVSVWYTDHASFAHGGMLVQNILYLAWPDLVARGDNHILLAVNQVKPAFCIHFGNITGIEVAVTNGIGSFFWLFPVARDDFWSPGK